MSTLRSHSVVEAAMAGASRSALTPGATSPRHMSHTPFRIVCRLQVKALVTSAPPSLRLPNREPRRRLAFAYMRASRSPMMPAVGTGDGRSGRQGPIRAPPASPRRDPVAAPRRRASCRLAREVGALQPEAGALMPQRQRRVRESPAVTKNVCILQVSRSLTIAHLRLVCGDCHHTRRLHFSGDEKRGNTTMLWRPGVRGGRGSVAAGGP